MMTKLLYLDDSYLKNMNAQILSFDELAPGRYRLVLDQTVFYPVGGGQATDQGKLTGENWEAKVLEVTIKDGEVRHIVSAKAPPVVGMKVTGEIDWERRYKLMKIHSGGHIVDFAVHILGYSPSPLMPYKGDHGKKAFIAYKGKIDRDIRKEVEDKSNELVSKKLNITWCYSSLEDLQKDAIYIQPGLPTNKPLRKVTLEGVGSVADGGTQVKETGEIGKIEVISVTPQGEDTIISYRVV